MPRSEFSRDEARRIALHAQGFAQERPAARSNAGHLRRVIEKLGLLQLDFVNVLIPAHRLVPYSRLGGYPHAAFDRAVYGSGNFTEQWAHEASIVPATSWSLLRHRRETFRLTPQSPLFKLRNYRKYLSEIIDIAEQNGPITSNDIPPVPGPKRRAGDWHRSVARWGLEHHFGKGVLAVAGRLGNYQRLYDLPERLLPAAELARQPNEEDARRRLLSCAASACGIATSRDLADYFRMTLADARPRIEELQESGVLRGVEVQGWPEPAWLHRDATLPRRLDANALLSPFDPLVWYRPRAERLFDFHYRIEIYVPEKKRRWGYYVLPFLCGDRLCARVDLKAERQAGVLQVRAAHAEPGINTVNVAERLAIELKLLAGWLGLENIKVARKGDLATGLSAAVRGTR